MLFWINVCIKKEESSDALIPAYRLLFLGSPDVNTEFSVSEICCWIWHVEFGDVENIYVTFLTLNTWFWIFNIEK